MKINIQIGFLGAYLIYIKWHFVPVFNGDLCTSVRTFSSLILATLLRVAMTMFDIHIDFNTKYDQLSLV